MSSAEPRTRSRINIALTEGYLDKVCIIGCTSQTIGPVNTAWDNEEMNDWVVSNYKRRIEAGEIINNPMDYGRDVLTTSGVGHHRYRHPNVKYDTTGPLTGRLVEVGKANGLMFDYSSKFTKDFEAEAKLKALANIDSTPFAFGEDALELKETVRFLRNPVKGLFNLSQKFRRDLKKRNAKSKYELLQAHAKLWLQYRFAVSPLIRSSIDALEAYSSETPMLPERLTSRGFSVEEAHDEEDKEGVDQWVFRVKRDRTMVGKATILYTVSNPVYDWNYRLGFRAKDWPTTMWQVVPYSFMVDRVLDITSFCKGVINLADPRVTVLMGCYSVHDDDVRSLSCVDRNVAESTIVSSDTRTHKIHSYDRVPWVPTVSDTVPKFNSEGLTDSATKIADLTSLILGNFRPF